MRRHLLTGGVALAACLLAASAWADPADASWRPGKGFTWSSPDGDNTLHLGGRIQARYTYLDPDLDTEEETSEFTAQRVRIFAQGHVFRDWRYKFQADFGKGKTSLKDASVTWARNEPFQVTFGQFKVRFDRQEFISSGKQTFVDRSLVTGELGLSRDVGVMLHGGVADGRFQWNLGVFNGEETKSGQPNDGHLVVARVSFNPNGDFGYSESNLKRNDDHLWFLDFAAAHDDDAVFDLDGDKVDDVVDREIYTAGFGYRHDRVYLQGEYFWDSRQMEGSSLEIDRDGWYFQVGVMLFEDEWELAARYSEYDPDDDVANDNETELTLAVNRFFAGVGHSLKLTADVSLLTEELGPGTSDIEDVRFRIQGQLVF